MTEPKPPIFPLALIADLHLDRQESHKNHQFQAVCAWMRDSVGELYILGDLWDAWLGDDSLEVAAWQAGYGACAKALQALTLARPVTYMVGNRDFVAGERLLQTCAMRSIADPSVIALPNGQKALLTHGDAWCLADTVHIATLPTVRHPDFIKGFLAKPMPERLDMLSQYHRGEESFVDIEAGIAATHMRQTHADLLIHGHTHRPAAHPPNVDFPWPRFVLHNWDVCPGMLAWDGQSLRHYRFEFDSHMAVAAIVEAGVSP